MQKKILADYHFHPNLPRNYAKAIKKAKQIWQIFEDVGLGVVLITEHSFKHPKQTFELMMQTRPGGSSTMIFPGVEVLTKQGVEMVCFAKHPSIYNHPYLMKPGYIDLDILLAKIEQLQTVYGFVTHPFSLSSTGMVRQEGIAYTKKAIEQLKAVEIHNSCYDELLPIAKKFGLYKLLPRKYTWMKRTSLLPDDFKDLDIDFYALSSDAHTPLFIGGGGYIYTNGDFEDDLFDSLIHNQNIELAPSHRHTTADILQYGWETFREWCIKKKYGI